MLFCSFSVGITMLMYGFIASILIFALYVMVLFRFVVVFALFRMLCVPIAVSPLPDYYGNGYERYYDHYKSHYAVKENVVRNWQCGGSCRCAEAYCRFRERCVVHIAAHVRCGDDDREFGIGVL